MWRSGRRFPRLYAAASLKRVRRVAPALSPGAFSAALCRGLIEALDQPDRGIAGALGFPRLYAAASLKRGGEGGLLCQIRGGFPRLYAAASLKPRPVSDLGREAAGRFPRLYAAASLKPREPDPGPRYIGIRFPRLYAAASLKRHRGWPTPETPPPPVFRGFMPRPH